MRSSTLVFLLNRVEKAVSSGGETKGALIVLSASMAESLIKELQRIKKEIYKIELFMS